MNATGPEAVILDPYRPYAHMLIQRMFDNHGVRTVCLHSNWRDRVLLESRFPILRSEAVSAHYMVHGMTWDTVAARLAHSHDIVAVLPYEEGGVYPMVIIAESLGLSWAQPSVQLAFRNKFALKHLVSTNDPSVRLNTFAKVRSAEETLDVVGTHDMKRFVLKPNAGSGNRDVAFFDRDTPASVLRAYFANSPEDVLLEEYIDGSEYWVNGQMDAAGEPTVVGIGQYYRVPFNDVENLEVGSVSVGPPDPMFAPLRDYTEAVMRATGLRRSPFHLEVIVDENGPCLVEVGARLCGELGALTDMAHHGPPLDLIGTAAHYYLTDEPAGPLPLNWERVGRTWTGTATGASAYDQRLIEVDGTDELEASDEFLFWVKRPEPGDFVHRTTNLTTRAWGVVLQGDLGTDPRRTVDAARHLVRLRGTAQDGWTLSDKWPMYAGVLRKMGQSRPRPYQLGALLRPLR